MIPAGARAQVVSYGRHRAGAVIDGKPMRLGHDHGREQESPQQWVARIIVPDDPRQKLAPWPSDVQDAVGRGQIRVGMTREQVTMGLGYPMTNENPSLDSGLWRNWISSLGPYQVLWDQNGRFS
ncbi:MAG: hypothetical protein K0R61_5612 [Microvirga sp.]|nr:hypothetical protein [Microvirga sp.]